MNHHSTPWDDLFILRVQINLSLTTKRLKSTQLSKNHTHFNCAISIQTRSVIYFCCMFAFQFQQALMSFHQKYTEYCSILNRYIYDSTSKTVIMDNSCSQSVFFFLVCNFTLFCLFCSIYNSFTHKRINSMKI